MLIGPDGRAVGVHYTPPPPPPPPAASDVSTAKQALQKQLGNNAPDNSAALAAAIQKIQQENAAMTEEALARAAILLQEQYDAAHHQTQDPNVDPITEAASQVGLTHQFDTQTLDDASKSLSDSALATTPAGAQSKPTVTLGDARDAIQNGLNNGLTWQEAVNAARVQFGGGAQNETVLDEAALTVKGDQLSLRADATQGNTLNDASQQLAGLHLFDAASDKAALAALGVALKPSSALASDAKTADTAWATLQQDEAAHASADTIAEDLQVYHSALDTEMNDAANQPAGGSTAWENDPSKSDLRWQAQQAVIAANTSAGVPGAPSASDILTSLRASQIVDAAAAARGNGPSNAPGNLKAAQTLTQELQGVPTASTLYNEVMGDMRVAALHDAALGDITGAHGDNPQDTLVAEGNALSSYRNTVLFQSLLHDTLASSATQHNLAAAGTPGKLSDIANLLDPLAKASPELAQALFAKLQGKIISLINQGPDYINSGMETPQQMDSYYGPLARIVNDVGGPQSSTAQPMIGALKTELQSLQATVTREQQNGMYSPDNPFQPLAYLNNPQNNDPTSLYQTLINQDPNSALGKSLQQYTGLKPQATPVTPAKDAAGSLATAETALDGQLRSGPVNASTLQKALAAARKDNPSISDKTWAEAVIARQAQSDAAANAESKTQAPTDLVAQASGEVSNDQLFDADTMHAATSALQSGQIADGGSAPKVSMSLEPGQPDAAQYMQGLVSSGMTMPEAIALTKAWLAGAPNSDLVLTQAALTVEGQQYLPTYYSEPNGTDPIDYAAQQLKGMNLLDPATIDLAVNGRPASAGVPAVTGMKQDVKPDLAALNGTKGQPGLVDKVNSAYATWQTAQAKADKSGSAQDKTAAQNAMQAYHAALSAALNAAAGRAPTDGSWQSDPAYVDTMWKAQNQLELTALAPQIEAAQYAGKGSPEAAALDTAFQQWQTGLDALQILGQIQHAQQLATDPYDPASGDVAAAQALTNETYGLQQADPQLYQQVMGDAYVTNLESSALTSVTSAAAVPDACTVDGNDNPAATARLHAEGTRLQAYSGTMLYAQLIDGVSKDPTTQQLFSTIAASVNGQKSDADKLKTLANTIEGTSPDLAAMLVDQMFQTGGKHSTFSPAQLVAWTKNANDMTQISRIYVAAGGAQNADMTALRKSLETMVTGDANFGGISYSSRLNVQTEADEGGAVVWGEDLGFGDLKKNGVQMQLAQDMLDDDPNSDLGTEIARETGFSNLGAPATPVSTTGTGSTTLTDDIAYNPNAGMTVTQDHHLAGLQWQDGMQTTTSYDQLLNTIGESAGLKADYAPASLTEEQTLADGQFALYDPNDTVFDAKGHKTTLGQMAQSLMNGEGVGMPDGLAPVTVASLSGEWWDSRTPSQGQQGTSFTLLEGVDSSGRMIDVGPADTTVRFGYSDWQSNTGFDKGFMMAQPHWVTNASGVVQMGNAYMVNYKPYDHWYDWDNLKSDIEMAAMVVGGVLAMITLPESAPLWLVLLSEVADAGFAVSAAVGTASSLQKIFGTPGGARDWVNWVELAANAFGGAASGMGALSRSGAMMDRLAASAPAFQDAASVTAVTRDTATLDFARAEVTATLNGGRAVRTFDDTWMSKLLSGRLTATDAAVLRTMSRTDALRALQGTAAFRLTGLGAMVTNATSMGIQGYTLATSKGQASAQDWLNLFMSAGLMASGVGVERMRAGDPAVASARVTAVNEQLPTGVRLLDSGDVEITPEAFPHLNATSSRTIALLTQRGSIAAVTPALAVLRDNGLLDEGSTTGGTDSSGDVLSADEVTQINKTLPSGMQVTRDGTLILGNAKGRDTVAQAVALVTALRVLNDRAQGKGDATPADPTELAKVLLTSAPASAEDYQQMIDRLAVLRDFWEQVRAEVTQASGQSRVTRDDFLGTFDDTTATAQVARDGLPSNWELHSPTSVLAYLERELNSVVSPGQFEYVDGVARNAISLIDAATRDTTDAQRAASGELSPYEVQALARVLFEQQFNGSRPGNAFGISNEGGSVPAAQQRTFRQGDVPYWDLTDAKLEAQGAQLTTYGDLADSPLRNADGTIRVRLHYGDGQDLQRMTDAFGPPDGVEPARMTTSLRTVQIDTEDGPQLMKFSMPERGEYGYAEGAKTLTPDKVGAAVQANDAADGFPGLAAEPAGLSLDLGDGGRPVTQLWRTMPVAGRGYEEGDFSAPLHVFTSSDFATSPLGQWLFGADATDSADGLSPQQQWLANEVAPRLADTLARMLTELQMHPMVHEQNVDVIVGADGRVVDVVVKDLSDLKLDPRAVTAFDGGARWNAADSGTKPPDRVYDASADGDNVAQFGQVERFYLEYLGQLGQVPDTESPHNPLLDAVVNHFVTAMQERIPADWLAARTDWGAHEIAFDESGEYFPWTRMAAVRELLLQYAEHPEADIAPAAGDDEAGPPAALARITPFVSSGTADGHGQVAEGIDASSLAPVNAVTRDAGSNGQRPGQRARGESQASEEGSGAHVPGGAKVTRVEPDQQQSRGTRNGQTQQQAEDEQQHAPAQGKAAATAKPANKPAVSDSEQAPQKVNAEPAQATSKPETTDKPSPITAQKITRYDVKSAIQVIKARFGKLILPGQQPDASQVALLEPEQFAQARNQAAQEGRGSFDDNVFGFTVVDGTMEIDGRQVRVVLPASIAPENVTASSLLMHDMLHFAQSPEFIAWSRELNARLNADPQVRANGWFDIDSHEGLTELFNVKIAGGAGAPGEDNTSFAEHVYQSFHQGYEAILYALDGAVNEAVVARIGEDVAARAYFQADPEALQAYENAMFDVYRNTPPALAELREFVLDNMGIARNGDGIEPADMTDAAAGPRGQDAPGAPHAQAGDPAPAADTAPASQAEARAQTEASQLLARLRAKAAEVAYARFGRWDRGDGTNRASGGSADPKSRAVSRIMSRLATLAPRRAEAAGEGEEQLATFEAGTDVDNLNASLDKRGLSNFYLLDGAGRAAQALRDKSEIVLVTGFSVDVDENGHAMAETDGPPGTAYLARVIEKLSEARTAKGGQPMHVTVVTDSANFRVMRAALDALGANDVQIALFDTPYGPASADGSPYDSGARPSAGQLLDRLAPDAVVAIELPAHTSVDGPINMRGKSVKGFNSARDALVEVANERGITTFGVGDGGNEAGVVQKQLEPWVKQNIPTVKLADGTELEFRSAVPVDHAVTAWNSSLGAQSIGVALLKLEGELDLAPDGAAYAESIDACARAGAVDGVSRVRAAAVDGFSASVHAAFTDALIEAARDDHGVFLPDRPAIVVVFDSSNGALVAHQELEAEISRKTGRAVQFVYVVDHDNAPYGQYAKKLGKLADLVRLALQTGDEIPSAELIVMACNTAHAPHYGGLMDLGDGGRPVINLIETTADMMLDEGGEHPALFATKTTVATHMYRDQVHELSNGQIAVQEVAAKDWADFVNDMEHASTDRAVRMRVQENVNQIVAQLDENTTSVWLCCTHYPALTKQIRIALDARGMDDVPIFNPMTEHGDVARAAMGWDALPDGVTPLVRNPAPIVLTTGPADEVEAAARELTGYSGVRAFHLDSFGTGGDLSAVHDALSRPKLKAISRLLATQWSSGGTLHHGSQTHIFVPDGAETAAGNFDPAAGPTMVLVGAEQGAVDGVAGASLIGGSLAQLHPDNVYVVPDENTAHSVRIAHAAAGATRPKIEVFAPGDDARAAAAVLLERVNPLSVVAVKVYGRNADGLYHNTDGHPVKAVPLDEILLQANARDLVTVGVGDAPVYAGLHAAGEGPWYEVRPRAARGANPMFNPGSVVTSKFPVTGPTATVASDGLLGALQAAGRLDLLLTPEQFGAVVSAGRDRYRGGNFASFADDQNLNGLRGSMTEALHEMLLSLRNQDVPPEEVPLDPEPGSDAPRGGAHIPIPEPVQGMTTPLDGLDEPPAAAAPDAVPDPDAPEDDPDAQASEVAYARGERWRRGGGKSGGAPDPAAASAPSEPDQLVAPGQWGALLARLDQGELRASGDAYVYLVQSARDPGAPDAPGGIEGKLIGWGVFPQGGGKARWLGQGSLDGPPGRRIKGSLLDPEGIAGDHYVVLSRRPLGEVGLSGEFPDAQFTDDPGAIAWPDVPAPGAASAGERGKASPVAQASRASGKTSATTAASSSTANPAGSGRPMRWTRIGTTFGGAFGMAAGTIDLAGHLALPAATASLCFIYRGSIVALRTRLGTLISRHVTGVSGADPEPHLDWIDKWLVQRGAAWGISRSVRQQYGAAVTTLRADPTDADALAVLARAPAQLYMPQTVLGNVNDVLQSATLAANVSINGAYVFEKGVSDGVVPFLTNLGFGLSNTVLTTKNLAARFAAPLRTAALGATARVQDLAQATVMTGYSLATIPWSTSDFELGTPLGLVKGGLDIVFGMGAAGQAFNDTRKITSDGTARPIRIARVHPLMFLGAAAVARFVLQWATLPAAPAVSVHGNGNQGTQPGKTGSGHQGSTGSQNGGKPGSGSGHGNGNGKSGSGSSGNTGKTGKPDVVEVKPEECLWGIAEDHLKEILSASEIAQLAPKGKDAETEAALQQLLQLNHKFDADPDLIFAGQAVVLNSGSK